MVNFQIICLSTAPVRGVTSRVEGYAKNNIGIIMRDVINIYLCLHFFSYFEVGSTRLCILPSHLSGFSTARY